MGNDNEITNDNSEINIDEKIKNQNDILNKAIKDKRNNLFIGLPFLVVSGVLFANITNSTGILAVILYIIFGFLAIMGFAGTLMFFDNSKVNEARQNLQYLTDEQELQEAKSLDIEFRSDKQFRLNQRELKRYYDVNLSHIKFLLGFGIFLLLIGLIIISITLILYFQISDTSNLVLILGCASGILIDFIGAVFVVIYSKTIETAISFHSKLADSNNLLLSNAIASKINDEQLRNSTLSDVAKNIIKINKTE